MKKEFIIYSGNEFIIEWYFDDRGKSKALEYFENLTLERKKKAFHLFKTMGDAGKISNEEKFRNENDQIYAFKPLPDRFLCFFTYGSKVIVTNAFEKKKDKLPPNEKQKALNAKLDYINRVEQGKYYE